MLRVTKIKPMFNGIVTTANKYPKNGIIDDKGLIDVSKADCLREYQTILELGRLAENQGLKVGDIVMLNYIPYYRMKNKGVKFNEEDFTTEDIKVTIEDVPTFDLYDESTGGTKTVLCLFDRDITCVVEGTEIPDKVATAEDTLEAKVLANKISIENHSGKGTKNLIV
jgi:hypothetical protein